MSDVAPDPTEPTVPDQEAEPGHPREVHPPGHEETEEEEEASSE